MEETLVQYVLVREDLGFPVGALMAQACHAAIKALHVGRELATTEAYLTSETQMHTCILGAKNLDVLEEYEEALRRAGVPHAAWVEEPERVKTALAAAPLPRIEVKPLFAKLRLFRHRAAAP